MNKYITHLISIISTLLVLSGCGDSSSSSTTDKDTTIQKKKVIVPAPKADDGLQIPPTPPAN